MKQSSADFYFVELVSLLCFFFWKTLQQGLYFFSYRLFSWKGLHPIFTRESFTGIRALSTLTNYVIASYFRPITSWNMFRSPVKSERWVVLNDFYFSFPKFAVGHFVKYCWQLILSVGLFVWTNDPGAGRDGLENHLSYSTQLLVHMTNCWTGFSSIRSTLRLKR